MQRKEKSRPKVFTVTENQSLTGWCRPLSLGQVVEELELVEERYKTRRFVADHDSSGELVWVEIPRQN